MLSRRRSPAGQSDVHRPYNPVVPACPVISFRVRPAGPVAWLAEQGIPWRDQLRFATLDLSGS